MGNKTYQLKLKDSQGNIYTCDTYDNKNQIKSFESLDWKSSQGGGYIPVVPYDSDYKNSTNFVVTRSDGQQYKIVKWGALKKDDILNYSNIDGNVTMSSNNEFEYTDSEGNTYTMYPIDDSIKIKYTPTDSSATTDKTLGVQLNGKYLDALTNNDGTYEYNYTITKDDVCNTDNNTVLFSVIDNDNQPLHLYLVQGDYSTITATANDRDYTSSTSLPIGTSYSATITGTAPYAVGDLENSIALENQKFLLKIVQSDNQLITVTTGDGAQYTSDVKLPYGTTWTATVTATTDGYTAGVLTKASGVLTENDEVSASEALIYYTLTIQNVSPLWSKIIVTANGQKYDTTVKLPAGTKWTAESVAMEAYDEAGTIGIPETLNATEGTLNSDFTIKATTSYYKYSNTDKQYLIEIKQAEHCHATVVRASSSSYDDGADASSTPFDDKHLEKSFSGSTFRFYAKITFDEGYKKNPMRSDCIFNMYYSSHSSKAGQGRGYSYYDNLDVDGYSVFFYTDSRCGFILKVPEDYAVPIDYSPSVSGDTVTLNIKQSNYQTITVTTEDGKTYTESVDLPVGTKWTAKLTANDDMPDGYICGVLNQGGSTLANGDNDINNNTVSATPATKYYGTINMYQRPHSHIYITVHDVTYPLCDELKLPVGTAWTASVSTDTGWTAGNLTYSSGSITYPGDNYFITASDYKSTYRIDGGDNATYATFDVENTYYNTCTLVVNYNNTVSEFTLRGAALYTFPVGASWKITNQPSGGYTASANATEGTIETDTTITITTSKKSYLLKILQSDNQVITVKANGKTYTSDVELPYDTDYTVSIKANDGYTVTGTLNKTSGSISYDEYENVVYAGYNLTIANNDNLYFYFSDIAYISFNDISLPLVISVGGGKKYCIPVNSEWTINAVGDVKIKVYDYNTPSSFLTAYTSMGDIKYKDIKIDANIVFDKTSGTMTADDTVTVSVNNISSLSWDGFSSETNYCACIVMITTPNGEQGICILSEMPVVLPVGTKWEVIDISSLDKLYDIKTSPSSGTTSSGISSTIKFDGFNSTPVLTINFKGKYQQYEIIKLTVTYMNYERVTYTSSGHDTIDIPLISSSGYILNYIYFETEFSSGFIATKSINPYWYVNGLDMYYNYNRTFDWYIPLVKDIFVE